MFSRDKWDEILESLSANWFRTIMTSFGVLWGIFILVIHVLLEVDAFEGLNDRMVW